MYALQAGFIKGRNTGCLERALVRCRKSGVRADGSLIVNVALLGRNIILVKILRRQRSVTQSLHRKLSGEPAHGHLHNARRLLEIRRRKILMNLFHYTAPDRLRNTGLRADKVCILIISCPCGAAVIIRVSRKPHIVLIRSGSCFTCDRCRAKVYSRTGTLGYHVLHRGGQKPCRCLLQHSSRLTDLIGIQNDITVMIRHLRVHLRLQIFAAVGNRCIGGVQLNVLDTLCNTAKCQCRLNIRENPAIDLFVVYQSGKAKVQQIFIAKLRRDVHKSLHGYDVHRVLDTKAQRRKSPIGFSVPVANRCAVRIRIRCIVLRGRQCQAACIQSRCISRYHLKGRAGLTHRIRRAVQCPVCLFLTSSAGNCKNISRVLILQRQRNLRLCRDIIALAKDRISGADNRILVLFLTGLRVFLCIKDQGKIRI